MFTSLPEYAHALLQLHLPPSFDSNTVATTISRISENKEKNVASLSWLFFLKWTILFWGVSAVNLFFILLGSLSLSLSLSCGQACYSLLGFCKMISGLHVCVRNFAWACNLGSYSQFYTGSGVDFDFQCVFRGKYTAQCGINIYCLFSHFETILSTRPFVSL